MNLTIPLKGSTSGRQYAGWEPRTAAMPGLGNRVLTGQRVPVGDDAARRREQLDRGHRGARTQLATAICPTANEE
jgi:hypothetical protein